MRADNKKGMRMSFLVVILMLFAIISATAVIAPCAINIMDVTIEPDRCSYSCYPSCTAYINVTNTNFNLTVAAPYNLSLYNTFTLNGGEVNITSIEEFNDTYSELWTKNQDTFSYLNHAFGLTTYQYRINVSLTEVVAAKWNFTIGMKIAGFDYNLTLDPYLDAIQLISPANSYSTSDSTPMFEFKAVMSNDSTQNCSLYVDDVIKATNVSVANGTNTSLISSSLTEGNYSWKIGCTNSFDETGYSITRNITITSFGDSYEQDNSWQNASWISTDNTMQTHNFYPAGDSDYVKFNVTAGSKYLFETFNNTDIDITDTHITLYDTDGTTELDSNDDITSGVVRTSRLLWVFNVTGTYYLKIYEFNTEENGSYDISIKKIGRLVPYLISPVSDIDAYRNALFNISTGVMCVDGVCENIVATLDPKEGDSKVDSKVNDELDEKDTVKVIVYLKDEESTPGLEDKKQAVKENQEEVLSGLDVIDKDQIGVSSADYDIELEHQYQTVNAIAGKITKKGLDKLKKDGSVEKIVYDKQYSIALDVSIPLVNADDVWALQINGENITGKDETVCIIDTGIDYFHSDFGSCSGMAQGANCNVIGGYDFANDDSDPYDDHTTGHGSHVAGIVASINTTYTGVAPDAKLVIIKAMDSSGNGDSSDIIAGIDWCVNNASRYNISVISMSLGDHTRHRVPCDDGSSAEADAINTAVANGIFVVAASGNDNYGFGTNKPGISSPACIINATSIGSTNDVDSISSFTNRDYLLDFMAPGSGIFATQKSGTHQSKSGTSMATPHVAGAAALLKQYFKKEFNRSIDASEIKHILKHNGVSVTDTSGTGLTFSRMDIFEASQSKGDISTVVGAVPFYTLDANPHDASCLGALQDGQTCNQTWRVNATGDPDSIWEFFSIYETAYENNITPRFNVTIKTIATYDDYGGDTTNFENVPDITNVTNATLEDTQYGRIKWTNNVDAEYVNFDNYVDITQNYIFVNISGLNPSFNVSAELLIYSITYSDPVILRDGILCDDCSKIDYSNGNLTFSVTHFTTYTTTDNATLTIWDSSDPEGGSINVLADQDADFYANYTYSNGTAVSGGNCTIMFNDSTSAMDYNVTLSSFEYNRSFSFDGDYTYSVFCNKSETLEINATDSIPIGNAAPTLTLVSLDPTNGPNGTTVTVTTQGAYDTNLDNLILRCGNNTNQEWNLCNSTSGQPELNCSFVSSWLDENEHTIYCIVDDGNSISPERNAVFTADNNPPGNSTVNNVEGDTEPKYWDTDDDGNTVIQLYVPELNEQCRWSVQDINYSSMNSSNECSIIGTVVSCNVNTSITSQTNQTIRYVSCRDQFENEQDETQNADVLFGVDWTKPSVTSNNDGQIHVPGYEVTLTINDLPNGTIVTVLHCNDSVGSCEPSASFQGINGTTYNVTFNDRGSWYLRWNATDEAGNVNETKETIVMINNLPNLEGLVYEDYINHMFNINSSVYDVDSSQELNCSLYYRDQIMETYATKVMTRLNGTQNNATFSVNMTLTDITPEVAYSDIQFYVNCNDNLENNISSSSTHRIPNNMPSVVSLIVPIDYINTSDTTPYFNWSSSTDSDTDDSIVYILDISDIVSFSYVNLSQNSTVSEYTLLSSQNLSDGLFYWRIASCDNTSAINNCTYSGNWSFRVDLTAPSITIDNPLDNGFGGGIVSLESTITDLVAVDKAWYEIINSSSSVIQNGNLNMTDNWDTTWNSTAVSTGNYTFKVYANDTFGNLGDSNVTFFTDQTKPNVQLNSPAPGYVSSSVNETIYFNCSASDNNELKNISLWTNITGTWESSASEDISGIQNESIFNVSGFSEGNYTWNCLAYDSANNFNWSATNRTLQISNNAPVLTANISNMTWAEDTVNSSLNISGYFTDSDGDSLKYTSTGHDNITISIDNSTGIVTMTPYENFTGVNYVVFTAWDPASDSADSNNITLTITPVNDAPSLGSLIPNMTWEEDTVNSSLNVSEYFTDVDLDDLNYTSSSSVNVLVAIDNNTGVVTITPNANFTGIDYVVFTAHDPDGLSVDSNNVSLNLTNVNDAPSVNKIDCYDESSFVDCSAIGYNDNLSQIRVNCTDVDSSDGGVTSASVMLYNVEDSKYLVNGSASTSDNIIWSIDYNQLIEDSGAFNVTVICSDDYNYNGTGYSEWSIGFGNLSTTTTSVDSDVSKYGLFVVNASVTCVNGECGNVNITLNESSGAVSTISGATPFFTLNSSNPYSYDTFSCLENLTSQCDVSWVVNASGTRDVEYELFILSESTTYSQVSLVVSNSFNITITNAGPSAPSLISPIDKWNTTNDMPSFNWTNVTDIDNDPILFFIEISSFDNFSNISLNKEISDTNYTLSGGESLSEGTWYWRIVACDNSGYTNNCSYSTENLSFTVDSIGPVINIQSPENNSFVSGDVLFSTNITDYGSGIDKAWYEVINSSGSVVSNGDLNPTDSWDVNWLSTPYNGGYFIFVVYANDTLGNNDDENITFQIDNTPPNVQLNSPSDYLNLTNDDITFNCSATDTNGLKNITLWTNITGVWKKNMTNPLTGTSNSTLFVLNDTIDGIFSWSCLVNDVAGNGIFASLNRTVKIDTGGPDVTIVVPIVNYTYGHSITFDSEITDLTGIDTVYYNITNESDALIKEGYLNSTDDWNVLWVTNNSMEDGIYKFGVWANDTYGYFTSRQNQFHLDNSIPTIYMFEPNGNYYGRNFNLNILLVNVLLNSSYYNITNSSGIDVWNNYNNSILKANHTWTDLIDISSFNEGNYTFNIFVTDYAVNKNNASTWFMIDKTLPSSSQGLWAPDTIDYSTTVYLNTSWTDLNGINSVFISHNASGNWVNYSATNLGNDVYGITIPSTMIHSGRHIGWKSFANDTADNWNVSILQNFTVINYAPVLDSAIPNMNWNEDTVDSSLNISSYFSDPDYDNLSYTFTTMSDINAAIDNDTGIVTFSPDSNFTGVNYVVFTAWDPTGENVESNNITLTIDNVNDGPHKISDIGEWKFTEDTINNTLNLYDYLNDIDGDTLTFTYTSVSDVSINIVSGVVSFTPDSNFTGVNYVVFTARDPSVLTVESNNVTINVTPENDAPIVGLLVDPFDGYSTVNLTSYFDWNNASDIDSGDSIVYFIEISDSQLFGYVNYSQQSTVTQALLLSSLSEGTWYWRIKACDDSNAADNCSYSQFRNFSIDLTSPEYNVTYGGNNLSNLLISHHSSSRPINIFADEEVNVSYSFNGGIYQNVFSDFITSGSISVNLLEGENNITINATDSAGNYRLTLYFFNFTLYTCTDEKMNGDEAGIDCGGDYCDSCPGQPPLDSGGGGGGGGSTPSSSVQTNAWSSIATGYSVAMKITRDDIEVRKIVLDLNNDVNNVEIKVEKYDGNPSVGAVGTKVYQYLRITPKNMDNDDIKEISFEFRVLKSWLTYHDIDREDVVLFRYSDSWKQLPTTVIDDEDETYVYYVTKSPGFSYFAIALKETEVEEAIEKEVVEEEESIEEDIAQILPIEDEEEEVVEEETPIQEEIPSEIEEGGKGYILWVLSILVLVGGLAYHISTKPKWMYALFGEEGLKLRSIILVSKGKAVRYYAKGKREKKKLQRYKQKMKEFHQKMNDEIKKGNNDVAQKHYKTAINYYKKALISRDRAVEYFNNANKTIKGLSKKKLKGFLE